ncbi:MAG TPA: DUF3156 family protein [Egicoccus sp.]|nr:DUF3156 family protein [Egicoccus sp.]HSK22710.1 DUF3156 family protein [Egicoccus sp.]
MSGTDLADRVAGDLDGCRLDRVAPDRALVETADGPRCWWTVRADRRRLLVMHNSVFHLDGPPADDDATIVLQHTGQLRRSGLRGRVRGSDRGAGGALRDRLLADGELAAASLPLDFTRFEVRPVDGRWRAELELMGGAYVRTRLPPSTAYVRLSPDQVAALLATVAVLHRRLPADPDHLRPTSPPPVTEGDAGHLPRRP